MTRTIRQTGESLGEFAFNEQLWPVGRPISDIEIDVMNLDVPPMPANDLSH